MKDNFEDNKIEKNAPRSKFNSGLKSLDRLDVLLRFLANCTVSRYNPEMSKNERLSATWQHLGGVKSLYKEICTELTENEKVEMSKAMVDLDKQFTKVSDELRYKGVPYSFILFIDEVEIKLRQYAKDHGLLNVEQSTTEDLEDDL